MNRKLIAIALAFSLVMPCTASAGLLSKIKGKASSTSTTVQNKAGNAMQDAGSAMQSAGKSVSNATHNSSVSNVQSIGSGAGRHLNLAGSKLNNAGQSIQSNSNVAQKKGSPNISQKSHNP